MSNPYEIDYADEASADIRALRAFDQRKILAGIKTHLTNQPKTVSRSRIKERHIGVCAVRAAQPAKDGEPEPHQGHGAAVLESVSPTS